MTEEQIRAGVVLAASRGVLSAFVSEESLGEAAKGYRLAPRTPEGDAFETAFEWAREIKAAEGVSFRPIREIEASARSRAFEEAAKLCEAEAERWAKLADVGFGMNVNASRKCAKKIRARAAEASSA